MPEVTAYHEAGHAFVALYLGARVPQVTIAPDDDDGPTRYGDTQILWRRGPAKTRAQQAVLVALAGPVAEMIHRGEPFHPGLVAEWADDWNQAWEAARDLAPEPRRRLAFLEQAARELQQMLARDEHWAALAAIVDHLLAHETLEEEMLAEILEPWLD